MKKTLFIKVILLLAVILIVIHRCENKYVNQGQDIDVPTNDTVNTPDTIVHIHDSMVSEKVIA
jgi:hypothetical protein